MSYRYADINSPVSPICASVFGCGTLYHMRNADSKHQELISVPRSTVPLKYRNSVSPEPTGTAANSNVQKCMIFSKKNIIASKHIQSINDTVIKL